MVTVAEVWKKVVDTWNKFEDWVDTGLTGIWAAFSPLIEMLYDRLEGFWITLSTAVDEFLNKIEDVGNQAKAWVDELYSIALEWVSDAISAAEGLYYEVSSRVDSISDTITSYISNILDGFRLEVSGWVESVEDLALDAWNGLSELSGLINMLIANFELFVEDALNIILDRLIETEEESKKYKEEGV